MVIKSCLENGNGEPIFESNGTFRVTMRSSVNFQFDETERKILEYLRERKVATRKEIEELLVIRESTARKYLECLQKKGLIAKVGKGKNTKYKIIEI
ncbi:MAG TPA: ArsR family transcriptional regulator [Candidatus Aenigmarchaeota archaeon]|nr:ArsR family transcriptional regulator [Candidatus Aenigmarchaeota archaeon]